MTRFDPGSWKAAADRVTQARLAFQAATNRAIELKDIGSGPSAVDQKVSSAVNALTRPWYDSLNGVANKMSSDASKLQATGRNYQAQSSKAQGQAEQWWKRI